MLWRKVIKPTHYLNPENLQTPIYLVMDSVINAKGGGTMQKVGEGSKTMLPALKKLNSRP